MPYKVSLTYLGGQRTQLPDICREPTPSVGDLIIVNTRNGGTRAYVTAVHPHLSKSPGTAVETVDDVEAQER